VPTVFAIVVAGSLLALALLTMLAFRQAAVAQRHSAATMTALDGIARQLNGRLDSVSGELSRTLSDSLQKTTHALTGSIGSVREETRAKIDEKFVQITERLGDLKATNDRIMEFSRSLDDFQRMLQSPKLRGDFGEFTLEQMLANLLPAECYDCQATFGGVRVDAVIHTPHGDLCIDSKFPLDNFRRALDSPEGAAREAALKAFYADVKARIEEIAVRYIAPPKTLDVAFMFVPAENVYYELLARPDLLQFGRDRRVIPVSPNTLYAYLQALAIGFRGLKIHQEARRVEQMLAELRERFDRFYDHFVKIGRHLENAQTQFQGALRDVDRFQAALQGLRVGRLDELDAAPVPDPESSLLLPASGRVVESGTQKSV
jgi:DNA recombination protein RmuC